MSDHLQQMTPCAYLPKAVQSDAIFGQKLLGLLDELRLSKSLPHADAAFAALQGKRKIPMSQLSEGESQRILVICQM